MVTPCLSKVAVIPASQNFPMERREWDSPGSICAVVAVLARWGNGNVQVWVECMVVPLATVTEIGWGVVEGCECGAKGLI